MKIQIGCALIKNPYMCVDIVNRTQKLKTWLDEILVKVKLY